MAYAIDVISALLAVFVSDTAYGCAIRMKVFNWPNGCNVLSDVPVTICICDTDLCNSGVMTSSLGHVIAAVAMLACVITAGYLQL